MGYIFAFIVLALGVFVVVAMMSGRGKGTSGGRLPHQKPVEVAEPASDEPTPGASDTASNEQVHNAKRRPPEPGEGRLVANE